MLEVNLYFIINVNTKCEVFFSKIFNSQKGVDEQKVFRFLDDERIRIIGGSLCSVLVFGFCRRRKGTVENWSVGKKFR